MKRKIFLSFFILSFSIILVSGGLMSLVATKIYVQEREKELFTATELVGADLGNVNSYSKLGDHYSAFGRLTLMDFNGKVLYDSSVSDISFSHKDRPEVVSALSSGSGSSIRYSNTTAAYYLYAAEKNGEYIVRLAVPIDSLNSIFIKIGVYTGIALIVTLLITIPLTYFLYKMNLKPIKQLIGYIEGIDKGDKVGDLVVSKLSKEYRYLAILFKKKTKALKRIAYLEEEKNSYLKNTIDAMENGFIAVNKNHKVTLINKEARKIFSVEGQIEPLEDFLVITQNMELQNSLNKLDAKSRMKELTLNNLSYKINFYPIKDKEDTVIGTIIFFYDVTETRALENIRKEFVANVSHELKTPLTSIRGFIETLKNGAIADPEVAQRFLDIIDVESVRLEDLISDVLNLSDIEERKEDQVKEPIILEAVVAALLSLLQPTAAEKNVTLKATVKEDTLFFGHPYWMKQLLLNLFTNGIEYNEDGGSVIGNIYTEKASLVIEVVDTGIGIPDEDQDRVFERFYKVDKSRSKNPNSTGLGLSIVKHIVELYSGDIEVTSALGEGTTFKIKLPINEGGEINE